MAARMPGERSRSTNKYGIDEPLQAGDEVEGAWRRSELERFQARFERAMNREHRKPSGQQDDDA
jgi:hypothetical protein